MSMTHNSCSNVARRIWVKWEQPGIHCYPDAPEEVSYLRDRHRHLFKFTVGVTVEHNDRDVEFHMLLNWCKGLYAPSCLSLDNKSCEMIAEELMSHVAKAFPGRSYFVEVSEDGECGAILEGTFLTPG